MLHTLIPTLSRHEKFGSRIRLFREFHSPSDDEILEVVLPQLVLPYWSFHPEHNEDRQMGQQLWKRVKPSFRDLRVVLTHACMLAHLREEAKITQGILEEAFEVITEPWKREKLEKKAEQERNLTPYEKESQQRQDARRRKKKR